MLVLSQAKTETPSSEDPTPRSPEDALSRKMTSKSQMIDSRALSKFHLTSKFCFFSFMVDQKTFDKTRPNFFRGYGATTKLANHEALHEEWSTTFRKTYLKPNYRTKPNAHTQLPVQEVEFDNGLKEAKRSSTIASGFQANA